MTMQRFATNHVAPEDLVGLSDVDFRAVVDADLRRRVRPEGLRSDTAEALRSPLLLERWYATLKNICESVEGQLVAAHDDHEMQQSAIKEEIARLEDAGANPARLRATYDSETQLRTDYLSKKAGRERFLTGVRANLTLATSLLDRHTKAAQTSSIEVDLRQRVTVLEQAIETHRRAVLGDLRSDEAPERYEEALWSVLAAGDD